MQEANERLKDEGSAAGQRETGFRPYPAATLPDEILVEPVHGRLSLGMQWLRGQPLGRLVRQLQEWERLKSTDFDRLHERRLQEMLDYARRRVPLYRTEKWRMCLSGQGGALESWPVLERVVLREHLHDLRALPQRPWHVVERTSGTTGAPVPIALTRRDATWRWAHRSRALLWHGIPIGARALRVSRVARPFRDWVLGQKNVPTPFTPDGLDEAVLFLRRERPDLVYGPPSALFVLARYLREVDSVGPLARFARVGGEQLFPFQRSEIEGLLARQVVDSYGCTEVGPVAGECPAGSMHVFAEHVHLEVLRGDAPVDVGDLGDIVLTSLNNTAMPLVRCRIGDRGRLSPDRCRCGLPHPVLADLQARTEDAFLAEDGSPRHSSDLVERLGTFFADPVSARARHVLLGQLDCITWRVWVEMAEQPGTTNSGRELRAIEDRLISLVKSVCGPGCRVDTRFVERIPRGQGKYRYLHVVGRRDNPGNLVPQ